MAEYEGSKAQQAHEIGRLLQQLTAVSRDMDGAGFLFRIVDAETGEVHGNARASQDVANAVQAALESMLRYAEADRPERMSGAAEDTTANPELAADVEDVFAALDPISLLDDVLESSNPRGAAQAYEDLVTGEIDPDGGQW